MDILGVYVCPTKWMCFKLNLAVNTTYCNT